jgi:hypothetical protein
MNFGRRLKGAWVKSGEDWPTFVTYVRWVLRGRIPRIRRARPAPQANAQGNTATYLAVSELARRYRDDGRSSRSGPLTEFELKCFSQNGEDGVIAEILSRIGARSAFFIEFGIQSGREGNCVFLADVLGWNGLFIEADQANYAALARKYSETQTVATLREVVTPENIEALFRAAEVPEEPAVLSIDVDGQEYWIWETLEHYRPLLLIVEYNAALPAGRQLVQPRGYSDGWDGTDYFGASLDALCALAERKGYRLAHTELAGINAFFVRADVAAGHFPEPERVPRRLEPNYRLRGLRNPPDPLGRDYTDLSV